jgi:orotidine-5'-phosphate decarboxylase
MFMEYQMQLLRSRAAANGPLCVGLDTDPSYLPDSVKKKYDSPARAVLAYNREIIRRVAADKSASCCKVQIAYYEAMGIEGMQVYAETLRLVRNAGLTVISDIKRGDIANTAAAYARAHFTGDFETDIITVNPYMGFDTLQPFIDYCRPEKGGKGIFVLLRTSNPGMADIEQQELKTGGFVLDRVGRHLERIASDFGNSSPEADAENSCSPVGAVVGCTEKTNACALRAAYPDIFFLVPGYGAQGGAAGLAAALLERAGGVVNSSRGILCAWKKDKNLASRAENGTVCLADIAQAAGDAAAAAKNDLLTAVKKLS